MSHDHPVHADVFSLDLKHTEHRNEELLVSVWNTTDLAREVPYDRTVLIDHSRHGTWVNGARVRERAGVRPGDRVRVGTPGVEFTLISAAAFGTP
jgi:pSer/pThr/pTyr-binding forkhead associated (FHA) protein